MVHRRPRVLLVSFSDISRDARVLRQLTAVSERAEVTTVGFGPAPAGATDHLPLPDGASSLPSEGPGLLALGARWWARADLAAPAARATLALTARRRFDAVIANEARAVPVGLAVAAGAPVWADLHEWAPEERTQVLSWRLVVAPWMRAVCARHLSRCAVTTTVSGPIAQLYREQYGVSPRVVRNAPALADLQPSPVGEGPLRLVHSGVAVPGRNLEALVDAVGLLGGRATLDLFLLPAGDGGRYFDQIRTRAATVPGVRFNDPVAPGDLPRAMNPYDVGVFSIPPINTNAAMALPNKFFDFVQARLAVAVGPSPSMAELVHAHGLGVVARDYSAAALADALGPLTPGNVARFKQASHVAAPALSAEAERPVVDAVLDDLLATAPGGSR